MSNEQEQIDRLRLLLSIKKHEQPPPGYFDRLPDQIISQIKLGRQIEQPSLLERLGWEAPWLEQFWRSLEAKPVFAATVGVAVCALALVGIGYQVAPEAEVPAAIGIPEVLISGHRAIIPELGQPMPVVLPPQLAANTGGVQSLNPAFIQPRSPYAVPVSTGSR